MKTHRPTSKQAKRKRKSDSRTPAIRHNAPRGAIVVRAPGPKPWLLKPEEIVILKNAVCKGATDKELEFCLAVARRYQLDPFRKQIWFVPRRDRQAEQTDGQQGGKVWVPVVSIDGLCHIAGRDHKDYGSFSEAEYGPMITISYSRNGKGATTKMQVPEWARIEAFKKGDTRATVGKVWWEEIYPNVDYSPLVRQMPRLMLAKCAKAQAIRLAYPATGGLYIEEEMQEQAAPQFTESGRSIVQQVPAAEQRYLDREKEQLDMLTPAQREVVDRRMAAEQAKVTAPPIIDIQPKDPPLFYIQFGHDLYWIDGPVVKLLKAKPIIGKFWNTEKRKHLVNGEQLEGLKYELPAAGFGDLKQMRREPGED